MNKEYTDVVSQYSYIENYRGDDPAYNFYKAIFQHYQVVKLAY